MPTRRRTSSPPRRSSGFRITRGGSGASFFDITQFITDHPDWPSQPLLEQRAEEAMAGVGDADLDRLVRQPPAGEPQRQAARRPRS